MALTELEIKNAKLEDGKKKKVLTDGNGLRVEIRKSSKSFVYRVRKGKEEFNIHLGVYPKLKLKQARIIRNKISADIDKYGIKEAIDKFSGNDIKNVEYFEDVAYEWLQDYKVSKKTFIATKNNLKNYIIPYFKSYKITEIKIKHLSDFLKKFKDKAETAKKLKITLSHIFKYALSSGYVEFNPVSNIKLTDLHIKAITQNYKAAKNDTILKAYFEGIDKTNKDIITKYCLKFIFYSVLRQGTVRKLKWEMVNFTEKEINITKEITKTKNDFTLPLTPQMVEILKEIYKITGDSEYIFTINKKNCISETALRKLKNNIEEIENISDKDKMNIHGIRSNFSTLSRKHMNEHKITHDLSIEFVLEHRDTNHMRDTYNGYTFLEKRRILLQWWDDYLDNL